MGTLPTEATERLPVGSVIEYELDERTVLLVQEAPDRTTIVESWEDALDLANRVLGRVVDTLDEVIAERSAINQRLESISAKIGENQRVLDRLVNGCR